MQADVQNVKPEHLKRDAYLYVRQSTPRQVLENSESTKRQYALRQRAIALGWSSERIIVIHNDLGHSGPSAVDREGFQKLVAEVGMGGRLPNRDNAVRHKKSRNQPQPLYRLGVSRIKARNKRCSNHSWPGIHRRVGPWASPPT
jgi:hypothetical protein